MGELTAVDVTTPATTQDLLDAALVAARRYCGWSVSPVETVTLTVDGPGGRVLSLPTLNLIALTAVVEEGVTLDVTDLDVSRRKGTVEKYPFGCWSDRSGAITVTMQHGFTEAEAADWRRAVIRLVGLMKLDATSQRDSADLVRKKIDDVEYQWAEGIISGDERLSAMFSQFRILPAP